MYDERRAELHAGRKKGVERTPQLDPMKNEETRKWAN
jgi:hypothetical protein